jgi:hypothetical protein
MSELGELEEIDFSWIDQFEVYKHYYLEDIETIHVHYAYLNNNQEIIKMNQEQIILQSPNLLSKEEITNLSSRNNILDNKKYRLFSILQFNIDVEPKDLHNFLQENDDEKSKETKEKKCDFLHMFEKIQDIRFNKSIGIFHDLNEIILFFEEPEIKATKKHKYTKRFLLNKLMKHRKTKKKCT